MSFLAPRVCCIPLLLAACSSPGTPNDENKSDLGLCYESFDSMEACLADDDCDESCQEDCQLTHAYACPDWEALAAPPTTYRNEGGEIRFTSATPSEVTFDLIVGEVELRGETASLTGPTSAQYTVERSTCTIGIDWSFPPMAVLYFESEGCDGIAPTFDPTGEYVGRAQCIAQGVDYTIFESCGYAWATLCEPSCEAGTCSAECVEQLGQQCNAWPDLKAPVGTYFTEFGQAIEILDGDEGYIRFELVSGAYSTGVVEARRSSLSHAVYASDEGCELVIDWSVHRHIAIQERESCFDFDQYPVQGDYTIEDDCN